jgi:hypothetical protein
VQLATELRLLHLHRRSIAREVGQLSSVHPLHAQIIST